MVRPYSIDLRERVLAAVSGGEPIRAVAARFGVTKLHARYRQTRSMAPEPQGGGRRYRHGPGSRHYEVLASHYH